MGVNRGYAPSSRLAMRMGKTQVSDRNQQPIRRDFNSERNGCLPFAKRRVLHRSDRKHLGGESVSGEAVMTHETSQVDLGKRQKLWRSDGRGVLVEGLEGGPQPRNFRPMMNRVPAPVHPLMARKGV